LQRSPYNIVRVELPAGQYDAAAALLATWKSTGVLAREKSPALYGYRMTYPGPDGRPRETRGVLGALALEEPGQGILPHEHTTPKAKSDRLELLRATNANTSPIWCLCTEPGLTTAMGPLPGPGAQAPTVATAVDEDGNTHEIWPIADREAHRAVAAVVGARPLLVADGHHRYETALAYAAERGRHAPDVAPDRDRVGSAAVMAFVVELSEDHVQIFGIHRVVSGLPAGTDLLAAFRGDFDVTPSAASGTALLREMGRVGALGVLTPAGALLAKPRPRTAAAARTLDSSRVDAALAVLPPHQLAYQHDVAAAYAAVGSGDADAAVFCRPASVAQIAATAYGGERMPPKTTFFWPKLRTGMVLRDW
jgi:uncharacterized protein (DUF1015 family)